MKRRGKHGAALKERHNRASGASQRANASASVVRRVEFSVGTRANEETDDHDPEIVR